MVSGLRTSPYDQPRTISGDARPIVIESNCSIGACCLNSLSKSFMGVSSIMFTFNVDAQEPYFLAQHVEGLGHARLHLVIAIDDALVHLRAAERVVRLDGQ